MNRSKPDIEQMERNLIYFKQHSYKDLRLIQAEHESYYWLTYKTKLNMKRFSHEIKRPRAMRIIEDAANNIAMDKLNVNIPPRLKGKQLVVSKEEEKRADHVGVWLQSVLDINSRFRPYFVHQAGIFGGLRGEAYLKLTYQPDNIIPLRFVSIDPLSIYASTDKDDRGRPLIVFEEQVHSVSYVRNLVEEWTGKPASILPDAEEHELAYWIEWWTPLWRGVLAGRKDSVDSTLLTLTSSVGSAIYKALPLTSEDEFIIPNPYGWVPFFRCFSGKGYQSADGEISNLAVGYLRGLEDAIVQEARELTKMDTVSSMYAAPPRQILIEGDFDISGLDEPLLPGDVVVDIKNKKETKFLLLPPLSPANREVLEVVREDFETLFPGVVRGVPQPGEPGVSLISRRSQAMKQWGPLAENIAEMLTNTLAACLEIVDKVAKEPVVVNGKSLSKDDVDGYYEINIDRKTIDPEEERIRLLLGKDMVEFYPPEDHAEIYLGQKNATDFVLRRTASKVLQAHINNPDSLLGRYIIRQLLLKRGMVEELDILEQEEKTAKATGLRAAPSGAPETGGPPIGGSPTRGVPGETLEGEVTGPEVERFETLEKVLAGE